MFMDCAFILFLSLAYLTGSIPCGAIISRIACGVDITTRGSRNIGATNVAREVGIKMGILTLAADSLKGYLPVAAAGVLYSGSFHPATVTAVAGLAALTGHQFSIFLRFRGGKGVSTALGVFLAICPLCILPGAAVFVCIVYLVDYVSVASMSAAACMPLFLALSGRPPIQWFSGLLMALLIIAAHRGNIARLMDRRERKWRNRHTN